MASSRSPRAVSCFGPRRNERRYRCWAGRVSGFGPLNWTSSGTSWQRSTAKCPAPGPRRRQRGKSATHILPPCQNLFLPGQPDFDSLSSLVDRRTALSSAIRRRHATAWIVESRLGPSDRTSFQHGKRSPRRRAQGLACARSASPGRTCSRSGGAAVARPQRAPALRPRVAAQWRLLAARRSVQSETQAPRFSWVVGLAGENPETQTPPPPTLGQRGGPLSLSVPRRTRLLTDWLKYRFHE